MLWSGGAKKPKTGQKPHWAKPKGGVKEQERKSAGLEDPLSDEHLNSFTAIQLHLWPPPSVGQ